MEVQRQLFQVFVNDIESQIKQQKLDIDVFESDARLLQVQIGPGKESQVCKEQRLFVRNKKNQYVEQARCKISGLIMKWFKELSNRYFSVKDKPDRLSKQQVIFYEEKLGEFRKRFPNFALV